MSKKYKELEKYKKAVRFEISFDDVNLEKANYEETEMANGEVDMTYDPKDLLEGLKKASKYLASKNYELIKAANNYFSSLKKIYKDYDIFLYTLYSDDDSQYPAPRAGHYIKYIITSINKKSFNIDEAIDILNTYIKNEKIPFAKKEIPDIGAKLMFDNEYADYFDLYNYFEKAADNEKIKIENLCNVAMKLGSKSAKHFSINYN